MHEQIDEWSYITNGLNLEKLRGKSVFISYGHDAFLPYARRLAEDLKQFVRKVWFDEQCIRASHKWDLEIEDGITTSDTIIAMMTQHAYRRPAGVCLNEVVYASNSGKEIVPVLVERISMPLLLCSIQYVDVCEIYDPATNTYNEDNYFDTLKRLLICIEDPGIELDGRLSSLKKYLQPMDNQVDIAEKTRNFVGREWMVDRFERWLEADGASPIYLLVGAPGTGKSSFAAHLAMTSDRIKGIHFCKYNDRHTRSLKTVIKTLAYHLAVQVEQYGNYLEGVDMEKLPNATDAELFSLLLLKPLQQISSVQDKIVLAIDGLDEMNPDSLNSFLLMLENYYYAFPAWFKLVMTARNNPLIVNKLDNIRPYVIDASCDENKEDIRRYLTMQIQTFIDRSEGVFQYAVFCVREIKRSHCKDFEKLELPHGLTAAYATNFKRCFPQKEEFDRVVSALEVLCAAQEPMDGRTIRRILKRDSYALQNAVGVLGDYIINRGDKVTFFHKSVKDWLTSETDNKEFFVDTVEGHRMLAEWAMENIDLWEHGNYLYKYGFYHMYAADELNFVYDVLNEDEDVFSDSFCLFVEDLLISGAQTKKLFSGLVRRVRNLPYILCKVIRVLYEKGEREEHVESILSHFANCCEWLTDYAELFRCLLGGRLDRLLEIGLRLVDVVDNLQIRLDICNYIGDSYRLLGDHENAFLYYQKVIDGYPQRQWAEKCFVSLYNYYDLRYVKGYLREAEQAIEKLGRQVPEMSFKRYKMWRLKGNIHFQAGRPMEAAECFRQSLAVAEHNHRQLYIAEANYSIAEALVGIDNQQALRHIETSREIAKRIHSDTALSRSYFAYVELLVNEGKWEKAIEAGKTGVELVSRTGYLTGVARIRPNMAVAYLKLGQYEESISSASFAHERYKKRNSYPAARIFSWKTLLEAYDKLDRLGEAVSLDCMDSIPNLHEFDNLNGHLQKIREFVERAKNQ